MSNKNQSLPFLLNQRALRAKNKKIKKDLMKRALIFARKNLRLNKANYSSWKEYARILLHQKKFKEALKAYQMGLKLAPKNTKHLFYNGLANVFRYMADYDSQAVDYYKKSILLYKRAIKDAGKHNQGLYWSNLSITYANLKDWGNAIQAIRKAVPLLKIEEKKGIEHGNQIKILKLEKTLYQEYKKKNPPGGRILQIK